MEQRRTRRFQLELPLSITRTGAERVTLAGFTKNISSSGVLFTAEREPDLGGPIEYVITLNHEGPQSGEPALHGQGAARRPGSYQCRDEIRANYQIAATLERYEFVRGRGPSVSPALRSSLPLVLRLLSL